MIVAVHDVAAQNEFSLPEPALAIALSAIPCLDKTLRRRLRRKRDIRMGEMLWKRVCAYVCGKV